MTAGSGPLKQVRKAVFPVAGLGTRFLPVTKASPKEMLAVVDKPLIQYAVEEAVAAGITEMIFVTGRTKRAIEDHFDKAYELENELALKNRTEMLKTVQQIVPKNVNCVYIRQAEPLGLGHAVLCARRVVNDEPFAVILADDLLDADPPVIKQMVDAYAHYHCSLFGVQEIPRDQTANYGIVATRPLTEVVEQEIKQGPGQDRVQQVTAIVEKPRPEDAPSTQAVVGRYILTPQIFSCLGSLPPGAGGEIQLTDGIAALIREQQVLAYRYDGVRYDCGSKFGYLQATVELGRKHPEVGNAFTEYLRNLAQDGKTPR
jgi:UTP--glucose-1-phosphate uridylyltransferase